MIDLHRCCALGALMIALAAPAVFGAEPGKPASTDQLLRSIGIAKPAMSSAPDFNLLDSNGSPVALSGYRGRWVLLNFWATWCGPCRDEMPSMERLHRQFGAQELAVIAVNQREHAAVVNRFMRAHGLNFSALLDTTGRVAGYYRVYGIPVTYLIDAHGAAAGMRAGPMDWSSGAALSVFRKLLGNAGVTAIDSAPVEPLPAALRARINAVKIRSRHDASSEILGHLDPGDDVPALGKVSGAGEFWYMVKTSSGAVGWVRGADVEEVSRRR